MSELEFRDPAFLWLLLLTPIVFYFASRRGASLRYSSLAILETAPQSLRVRLAILPAILIALSLASLVIALAGPRTPDAQTKVSKEGIAIMMVVDHSGSMQARDLVQDDRSVDRLSVVKQVFREFVLGEASLKGLGRPNDSIGLIAFAAYADSLCPLTNDHGNLTSILNDVEIVSTREEDGTAIGDGLALAVERLRQSKAKSKVAILLTDGVNNAGALDPRQAAEVAAAVGVKVYCIGAGSEGMAPFPFVDPFTGRDIVRMVPVQLDEETLREIADQTDGRYFRATDRESLREVYAEIDSLERTEVTEVRYLQYHEQYRSFVVVGMLLFAIALIGRASVFRTLP